MIFPFYSSGWLILSEAFRKPNDDFQPSLSWSTDTLFGYEKVIQTAQKLEWMKKSRMDSDTQCLGK